MFIYSKHHSITWDLLMRPLTVSCLIASFEHVLHTYRQHLSGQPPREASAAVWFTDGSHIKQQRVRSLSAPAQLSLLLHRCIFSVKTPALEEQGKNLLNTIKFHNVQWEEPLVSTGQVRSSESWRCSSVIVPCLACTKSWVQSSVLPNKKKRYS